MKWKHGIKHTNPFNLMPCEECENGKHKKCAYIADCFNAIDMGHGLEHFKEIKK